MERPQVVSLVPSIVEPTKAIIPIIFNQEDRPTCITSALANGLNFMGYEIEAKSMEDFGRNYVKEMGSSLELISQAPLYLIQLMKRHQWQLRALVKHKNIAFDILHEIPTGDLKCLQLLSSDGDDTHSVAVIDNWVFDSNYPYAMPLTRETLNDICGNNIKVNPPTYVRVKYGYSFVKRTLFHNEQETTKMAERTKKQPKRKRNKWKRLEANKHTQNC